VCARINVEILGWAIGLLLLRNWSQEYPPSSILGGFAWWIVGWLRSLKGAVDAQKETIAAQKEFIQGLQTVLDVTDTPKMLERIEAYKKLVDHEKEAFQQDLKRTSAEEREKILNEAIRGEVAMIDVIADLMPYVPIGKRKEAIASANVHPVLKGWMHRLCEQAPDVSESTDRLFSTLEAVRAILSSPPPRPPSEMFGPLAKEKK
jgi:hypothetical protein